MTALRNLAIGALHLLGRRDITEATRWATRAMDRPFKILKLTPTKIRMAQCDTATVDTLCCHSQHWPRSCYGTDFQAIPDPRLEKSCWSYRATTSSSSRSRNKLIARADVYKIDTA